MSGVSFAVGVVAIDPVPAGGTTGQALVKKSDSDYDTQWSSVVDPAALGTMSTQNADSVAITGGAINGTTIGSTTPDAGTFTTLTSNGATTLTNGSATLSIDDGGSGTTNTFRLIGATSGLGRTRLYSGNQLRISVGSINPIQFHTGATSSAGGDGVVQAAVTHTASAVNYWNATGAATTKSPIFSVAGSDSNISQVFQPKGTGAIDLAAGSSGVNISNGGTVTAITRTAAGSNYTSAPSIALSAPTTAGGVQATATTALGAAAVPTITSGGTGYTVGDILTFVGGVGTAYQLRVDTVSGGVITGISAVTQSAYTTSVPTNPVSVTGGTGTGATFTVPSYAIIPNFTITNAGSGYVEQPTVTFSGGGGGSGAAAYATVGSGAVIRSLGATNTQSIDFHTPASITNGVPAVRIRDVSIGTANTGYMMLQNNNGYAQIIAQGPTDSGLAFSAAGAGIIRFNTGGTSEISQFRVAHTASAVNYVQVTGGATTARPIISAQGSDSTVGMNYTTKGGAPHAFYTNTSNLQFVVSPVTNPVNYIDVRGAIANSSPVISVAGGDTNIDLALTPKGTGLVRFGTYTAGAPTATGYISIKAADGTTYKVLVGT